MLTVAKDIRYRLKFRKTCQKFGSLPLIAPREIRKCGFLCKLPLFDHFCGAPTQLMKISDFPIYSFTNDLLP